MTSPLYGTPLTKSADSAKQSANISNSNIPTLPPPGKMLLRDHQHRLRRVPRAQPALVPLSLVVLPRHVKLLLLRRVARRLLRRTRQQERLPPLSSQIPPVHLLLHVRG